MVALRTSKIRPINVFFSGGENRELPFVVSTFQGNLLIALQHFWLLDLQLFGILLFNLSAFSSLCRYPFV